MAANNKAIQVRIDYLTAANAGHQHAHELRIGPQPEYVDEKRAHLNRILIEPLTGSQLRKISEERRSLRKVQRGMKSNAAVGIYGIITFGHKAQLIFEALPIEKQDEAYWEVAERIAVRLNTTLTGLVSHGDETSPHAHFQCPGFTLDGQPVSAIAKREAMRDIQDIAAEVIKQYAPEIERGKSRWQRIKEGETYADTVHKSGAMMRHLLPEAIAEKERELSEKTEALQNTDAALKAVSADLEKATTELEKTIVALAERREYLDVQNKRVAEAIRKAEAEEDNATAAEKRAKTYEARAQKAEAEVERLEKVLHATQVWIERLEKQYSDLNQRVDQTQGELDRLNSAVAQKKTNIATLLAKKSDLQARLQSLSAA